MKTTRTIFVPLLIIGLMLFTAPKPAQAAGIAFDTSMGNIANAVAGSLTLPSFTTATANEEILIYVQNNDLGCPNTSITSVTVDGNAATLLDTTCVAAHWPTVWIYAYLAPSSGSHTIVVSGAGLGANAVRYIVGAYSGVASAATIDDHQVATQTAGASLARSVTTTVAGDWIASFGVSDAGTLVIGTGLGSLRQITDFDGVALADSNATVSVGSNSVTWTQATRVVMNFAVAMKPVSTATFDFGKFFGW